MSDYPIESGACRNSLPSLPQSCTPIPPAQDRATAKSDCVGTCHYPFESGTNRGPSRILVNRYHYPLESRWAFVTAIGNLIEGDNGTSGQKEICPSGQSWASGIVACGWKSAQ